MIRIFLFAFLASILNCANSDAQTSESNKEEGLNVGFLVAEGFYTTELTAPLDVFNHINWMKPSKVNTFVISEKKQGVKSAEGLSIMPDYSFADSPPIDILVVPSGYNTIKKDIKNERFIQFVKAKGSKAKYIMSLCDGAFVLAEAGFLKDKHATTYPAEIQMLKDNYPETVVHENLSFVHDGKIITSGGGARSFEAALYVVEKLFGEEVSAKMAKWLLLDWSISSVSHYTHNK